MSKPHTHTTRYLSPAEHLAAPVWMPPVSGRSPQPQPTSPEELERRRMHNALRKRLIEVANQKEPAK